jgi:hypothetical protein
MRTTWWERLDENDLMRTTWWERLDENDLMMRTTWWWERLDDENDLMMKTIWWWKRFDDENDLMMKTIWWWRRFDDENDLMMKTIWWWKRFDDENDLLMMKTIYLSTLNWVDKEFFLIFLYIVNLEQTWQNSSNINSRIELRALISSTRSNINPRVGFELLSETRFYGQANLDRRHLRSEWRSSRRVNVQDVVFSKIDEAAKTRAFEWEEKSFRRSTSVSWSSVITY